MNIFINHLPTFFVFVHVITSFFVLKNLFLYSKRSVFIREVYDGGSFHLKIKMKIFIFFQSSPLIYLNRFKINKRIIYTSLFTALYFILERAEFLDIFYTRDVNDAYDIIYHKIYFWFLVNTHTHTYVRSYDYTI